jgi:putative ATPase
MARRSSERDPVQPRLIAGGEPAGETDEAELRDAPLATRMRPRSLDELVGQEHLVGADRALRRAIDQDRVGSMILWGPPGSGKTTLAMLIGRHTRGWWSHSAV